MINIKRIYEIPEENDGFRVLVDRLWPQGESKEKAHLDMWLKEIAPSNELRDELHHENLAWNDFVRRYESELDSNVSVVDELLHVVKSHSMVTFLYASKNADENNAVVLKHYVEAKLR